MRKSITLGSDSSLSSVLDSEAIVLKLVCGYQTGEYCIFFARSDWLLLKTQCPGLQNKIDACAQVISVRHSFTRLRKRSTILIMFLFEGSCKN